MPLDFATLQREHADWAYHNFGPSKPDSHLAAMLGVMEEVGELSHSVLKGRQGIRGTPEEHRLNAQDAVGDIVIFLSDFCTRYDIDFQHAVEKTWAQVKQRDWTKNKVNGTVGTDAPVTPSA